MCGLRRHRVQCDGSDGGGVARAVRVRQCGVERE